MSLSGKRPLVRGAELSDDGVLVPLRERILRRAEPGTPEAYAQAAREEAEAAIAGAQSEADQIREAARRDGFEWGRAEAAEEVAGAMAVLAELGRALVEAREALEDTAVQEATTVAVEVAARLVRAELAIRPERVTDVVRGAIRRAADRSRLVARVSPADLAACREAAPSILEDMGGITSFAVVDDPRIMAGSCVLETAAGDVDATFESQLARVLEALTAPPDESLLSPAGP